MPCCQPVAQFSTPGALAATPCIHSFWVPMAALIPMGFCCHLLQVPGIGQPVPTSHGLLFLHEKAAALFLQACWESERKLSPNSLQTVFQNLKKGCRDNLEPPLLPSWTTYKAAAPEAVLAFFKECALEKNKGDHPAKEQSYMDASQVEQYCIQDVLLPLQFSSAPPPAEKVMGALWQRVQVAKSTRSQDLFSIQWQDVGFEGGTPYLDLMTRKPIGGHRVFFFPLPLGIPASSHLADPN